MFFAGRYCGQFEVLWETFKLFLRLGVLFTRFSPHLARTARRENSLTPGFEPGIDLRKEGSLTIRPRVTADLVDRVLLLPMWSND